MFMLTGFRQNGKNDHGALAGRSWVKGTNVDKFLHFFFKEA